MSSFTSKASHSASSHDGAQTSPHPFPTQKFAQLRPMHSLAQYSPTQPRAQLSPVHSEPHICPTQCAAQFAPLHSFWHPGFVHPLGGLLLPFKFATGAPGIKLSFTNRFIVNFIGPHGGSRIGSTLVFGGFISLQNGRSGSYFSSHSVGSERRHCLGLHPQYSSPIWYLNGSEFSTSPFI